MLDFVGFTSMAVSQDPSAIISELNDIFSAFDRIAEMFGCERLKTIGDAYMAVSGLPEPAPDHAQNVARVALRIRRYLERRNAAHPQEWRARMGINTGPVIGSLVGIQKYVYDLFGPGVNPRGAYGDVLGADAHHGERVDLRAAEGRFRPQPSG